MRGFLSADFTRMNTHDSSNINSRPKSIVVLINWPNSLLALNVLSRETV